MVKANIRPFINTKPLVCYLPHFLKNNKEYIGVHSTNDFNDDYMGSGSIINRAISKHGIDSFCKEILSRIVL